MSRFRNSARKSPVSVITTVLAMLGIAIVAPALTMTSASAVSPVTVVVHVTDAVSTKSVTIKNSAGTSTLATETAAYADDYGSFAVLTLTAGTENVQISASGYTARGEISNVKANPEVWIDSNGYVKNSPFEANNCQFTVHYVATSNTNAENAGLRYSGDGGSEVIIDSGEGSSSGNVALIAGQLPCDTKKISLIGVGGTGSGETAEFTVDVANLRSANIWIKDSWPFPRLTSTYANGKVKIHFYMADQSNLEIDNDGYSSWGVHSWTETTGGCTCADVTWGSPLKNVPGLTDLWGITFEIPVVETSLSLPYIIHKGGSKDPSDADQFLNLETTGGEVWLKSRSAKTDGSALYTVPVVSPYELEPTKQKAIWLNNTTIAYPTEINTGTIASPAQKVWLYVADNKMTVDNTGVHDYDASYDISTKYVAGMSQSLKEAFPYLSDFRRFNLTGLTALTDNLKSIFKKQVLLMVTDTDGVTPIHVTGVQLGYALDTVYPDAKTIKPGVVWATNGTPTITVWAPTASAVSLNVYDNPTGGSATTYAMTEDAATGGWSYVGTSDLKGKYYTFNVNVYAHSIAEFVSNEVTDPYSYSLSMNGARSQFVNLKDAALKPAGWDSLAKKSLGSIADATIYEMMIRDFSAASSDVSANYRGGFMAFTEASSKGMTHLKNLAKAGLTHLEIGPAFDIVSVNEDKNTWDSVDEAALANATPNGTTQRDAVKAVQNSDGFNWGYDPMHYTVPDGSFATDPNGSQRVLEFRSMVKGLAAAGLRTTMDVVYNHTSSSGQKTNSVLDKIVPGYYYRLTTSGTVETSTCCQNTASERTMMAKLIRDSIRTWAVDYKVDGFRFDLMGHHPKSLMVQIRKDLDALTIANSGVDGKKILLFGEGWNFGEVVDNSRFVNATQNNMAGTRVGTFDDRMRDAVRGGGPFDNDPRKQGFGSGINSAPNGASLNASTDDKLQQTDWVKAALGGSVANLEFMTMFDWKDTAGNIGYNGNGAGYTTNPVEQIAYVDAHDNETLFDSIAYKLPATTTMANRIRYQNISLAVSLLSEGIPFTLAGSDLLRSKSLDRDSYNSGDWFNAIHWDLSTNGFGRGLPINLTGEGDSDTTIKARAISLLGRATLKPTAAEMTKSSKLYQELLKVRYSSPLFRLATGANVVKRVKYLNGGSKAKLGFIVEQILDSGKGITDLDKKYKSVVIVYNTTAKAVSYNVKALKSATFILNPVQAKSVDSVVKTSKFKAGTFTVPALTVAVFMQTK